MPPSVLYAKQVASEPSCLGSQRLPGLRAPDRRLGEPHLPAGKQTPGGKQALGRQTPGAKLQASARKGRALGDITNLSKPPLRPQAAKQAAAQPASTQERHQRQQTALSRPALQPLASPTYDEPIEALAGKGWRQMAREAEEREDQEIAERVRNLWRILPPTPEPSALSVRPRCTLRPCRQTWLLYTPG